MSLSHLPTQIYSGQFLSDKSVKTGVEVEIVGLPGDQKRKFRTKWCATPNSINPIWTDEPFVFEKVGEAQAYFETLVLVTISLGW